MEGEAYLDVVWKQFRKNKPSVRMLGALGVLALLAILAPAIASNEPYWFVENGRLLFPWVVGLLNAESAIDFVFNTGLLVLLPWAFAAWTFNRSAVRAQAPGRRRVFLAAALFPAMLGLSLFILGLLKGDLGTRAAARLAALAVPGLVAAWKARSRLLRDLGVGPKSLVLGLGPFALLLLPFLVGGVPSNEYFSRDFKREQFHGRGEGFYPPIPYGPYEQDLDLIFKPPLFRKTADTGRYRETQPHFLGTDDAGRDILVRLLYGTRISLTIGVVAVGIYVCIGIVIGAIAGYFAGRVDMVVSRLIEIVLLFPSFFLILTLVALIGPSLYMIMIVIGLTNWPTTARLMRGEFLKQRAIDYVAAARALGASNVRVMFRHILPNAFSPIFVTIPFGIASAIVTEAGLSVLGFGARPPTPSWGATLNLAVSNYEVWWCTVFGGLAIFLTMAVFNIVGNGLRDAMDPRLKGTQ